MASYTTDNGQTVTCCDRCGQRIVYVFEYKGKVYGSDCIIVMKGHKPDYYVMHERADGVKVIDEEATIKRDEDKQAADEKSWAAEKERSEKYTAALQETYRCHHEGLCVDCKQPIEAKRLNFAKFKRIMIERCKACADKRKASFPTYR